MIATFKNQNGGRSPIENKQLHFRLESRSKKFIRMCTIVTSSDMTSFIYIGDEKHHLSKKKK